MYLCFALTHEVDSGGSQHRDSGHGDLPGPRLAYPSTGWGDSDRPLPSLVWGYTLEITALEKAAGRKGCKSKLVFILPDQS